MAQTSSLEDLDPQQREAVAAICTYPFAIITGGPGCHRKGQKLLRATGELVAVEDVRVGDLLAGYNGAARRVLELRSGFGAMVRIVPVKGDPFVVNADHVLTVVHSVSGEVTDVSAREYVNWTNKRKHHSKLFRQPYDFLARAGHEIGLLSPYVLGVLLGDGCLSGGSAAVANPDPEIATALHAEAERFGLRLTSSDDKERCPSYRLSGNGGGPGSNALVTELRALGIHKTRSDTKFIPQGYKLAPQRFARLELLAGLLDTDGHLCDSNTFDYISKSATLAHDVAFVARSVGLAAYVHPCEKSCQTGARGWYWRVSISGHVDMVPMRVARKHAQPRQQIKDALRTGFRVELLPEPETFYGFTLDGDGRYLLDDYTVTHNTGKTTTLRAALDALDTEWQSGGRPAFADQPYVLCAPTGKAAKRMEETTGRNASTIHRLLAYKPGVGFTCNKRNPLQCAVVIVDEASMLDIELAAAVFTALSPHTRLVLVGDVNQLPPVGPGQPFADFIACGRVPTVRLQTLHRSAAEAWISTSAPLVLQGTMPPLDKRPDFEFVRVRSVASVLQAVRKVMTSSEMQLNAQVLIPMREGNAGTNEANIVLQAVLNDWAPGGPTIVRDRHHIRAGDRVIQTRNNYDLGVFNGEIGEVEEITTSEVVVQFAQARVAYQRSRGDEQALELAYALTVHKSQGSEFPWVVVVVHSTHTIMLNRRLFYTAITRAKQGVILVGDDLGLERALGTGFTKIRHTTLVERLNGTLEPIIEPPTTPNTARLDNDA